MTTIYYTTARNSQPDGVPLVNVKRYVMNTTGHVFPSNAMTKALIEAAKVNHGRMTP